MSAEASQLTEEQRERIEANRLAALEKRRKKEQSLSQEVGQSPGEPSPLHPQQPRSAGIPSPEQRQRMEANRLAALERRRKREQSLSQEAWSSRESTGSQPRALPLHQVPLEERGDEEEGAGGCGQGPGIPSPEQRQRMEANRLAALERRRKKEQSLSQEAGSSQESTGSQPCALPQQQVPLEVRGDEEEGAGGCGKHQGHTSGSAQQHEPARSQDSRNPPPKRQESGSSAGRVLDIPIPGARALTQGPGVYVLELQGVKWYVGESACNVAERVRQHVAGGARCAKWVRLHHPPVQVHVPIQPPRDDVQEWERDETVARMLRHGFSNVRGWEITETGNLTRQSCATIRVLCTGFTKCCRNCGVGGHFADRCPGGKAPWLQDLESLQDLAEEAEAASRAGGSRHAPPSASDVISRELQAYRGRSEGRLGRARGAAGAGGGLKKFDGCRRCGRDGHSTSQCFAKTTVEGFPIEDEGDSDDDDGEDMDEDGDSGDGCRRCGRDGHSTSQCFARTTVEGFPIEDEGDSDDDDGEDIDEEEDSDDFCRRCGRDGHSTSQCFARTTVNGSRLY